MRVEGVQSIVDRWKPRDQRGRDSKKRFEDHLKKMMAADEGGDDDDEVTPAHVTASAVVLGQNGTLLYPQDLMPMWSGPQSRDARRDPAGAAKHAAEVSGVSVSQPKGGPQLVDIEVQNSPDGRTHLDLRFLLFADDKAIISSVDAANARWFSDEEAKAAVDDSYKRALDIAHSLRDIAAP